ncbi:hypothetical protein AC1031_007713 [Aphanomyces cochlioides]|nr:hypothetical protein AC1031_007713 [Aphanomyces cochlioides]
MLHLATDVRAQQEEVLAAQTAQLQHQVAILEAQLEVAHMVLKHMHTEENEVVAGEMVLRSFLELDFSNIFHCSIVKKALAEVDETSVPDRFSSLSSVGDEDIGEWHRPDFGGPVDNEDIHNDALLNEEEHEDPIQDLETLAWRRWLETMQSMRSLLVPTSSRVAIAFVLASEVQFPTWMANFSVQLNKCMKACEFDQNRLPSLNEKTMVEIFTECFRRWIRQERPCRF